MHFIESMFIVKFKNKTAIKYEVKPIIRDKIGLNEPYNSSDELINAMNINNKPI